MERWRLRRTIQRGAGQGLCARGRGVSSTVAHRFADDGRVAYALERLFAPPALWQPMTVAVACRDWSGIVYPGHWGIVWRPPGANETPEQALRLEAWKEGINGEIQELPLSWFFKPPRQPAKAPIFFRAALPVPIEALELLEGQTLVLASLKRDWASGANLAPPGSISHVPWPLVRRPLLRTGSWQQSGLASLGMFRPWAAASGEDCFGS